VIRQEGPRGPITGQGRTPTMGGPAGRTGWGDSGSLVRPTITLPAVGGRVSPWPSMGQSGGFDRLAPALTRRTNTGRAPRHKCWLQALAAALLLLVAGLERRIPQCGLCPFASPCRSALLLILAATACFVFFLGLPKRPNCHPTYNRRPDVCR